MVPDLVVLSNDSSSSGSENETEDHEDDNNKVKTEENSLTPPLNQDKSEGEASEGSGQDSGDDTDSSGSTTSSSKSSQSSGMCDQPLIIKYYRSIDCPLAGFSAVCYLDSVIRLRCRCVVSYGQYNCNSQLL